MDLTSPSQNFLITCKNKNEAIIFKIQLYSNVLIERHKDLFFTCQNTSVIFMLTYEKLRREEQRLSFISQVYKEYN